MQKVRLAAPLLVALVLATSAQTAPPGPNVRLAFAQPPYSLAASCDLSKPLAVIHLLVTNPTNAATSAGVVFGEDQLGALGGSAAVPPFGARATLPVDLPLQHVGLGNPGALGGVHPISVSVRGTSTTLGLALEVPQNFCPSGPAHPRVPRTATPKPGVEQAATNKGRDYSALLTPVTPANLRSVSDRADCGVHVGPLGAFVCTDMMKSGDVLLIWDYQPSDLADIDGYHIYRVQGTPTLIGTQTTKGVTLFDVPKPPGGYNGVCYSVTAYSGKRDSHQSNQFCAGTASAAKTVVLAPFRGLSMSRVSSSGHEKSPISDSAAGRRRVGYEYVASKGGLEGDLQSNVISRYALLFDVRSLLGRHVVEAHLSLRVLRTVGKPNCTNSIGYGTEDWWSYPHWPEGYFTTPDQQMLGNELRIDVTNAVATWMAGRLNQGVILRNDGENLNVFTNDTCQTDYTSPALAITYY